MPTLITPTTEKTKLEGPVKCISRNGMLITLNPTGHFDNFTFGQIVDVLGPLPGWLETGVNAGEDAVTALTSRYEFGNVPMIGGHVNEDGVYLYPKDADLHPLASVGVSTTGEEVYFYQYAMVSIVNPENGLTLTYRMD